MTLQDIKDIAKSVVIEVIAIALGVFVGALFVQQAAPIKFPPAQVTVIVRGDTSLMRVTERSLDAIAAILDTMHKAESDRHLDNLKMSETRFNNYVNH